MRDVMTVDLDNVYTGRFTDEDAAMKNRIWRELTRYLQRHVDPGATVLDIACDRGDFIRNIRAGEKWAADLRDVSRYLPPEITFVRADGLSLAGELPTDHFDVVFMSNYLEHLPSSDAVIEQLRVSWQLLRPGGKVVVLQPNIRLVGGRYWDFIDHRVALTDRSLIEAAQLAGLRPTHVVKRFLPYTTKTRLPKAPLVLRAYLALRPAWLVFGKQSLFVAEKPG
jgi:2-polyprenyl-3-methyl-5-hydroxy-6-metoxy-1,4-benzoquinol methylase